MISCKIVRKNLVLEPKSSKNSEKPAENPSFSIKNFRLLTSHLKSRKDFLEVPEESKLLRNSSQRPRTTPNFYWNFLSFEERKQQSSLEKTLQRLNIRSFNNILRLNDMKRTSSPLFRNSTAAKKRENSVKLQKSRKMEYYTLENVKYNNYKYKKIENSRLLSGESEKLLAKDESFKRTYDKSLIEKLKANRIVYFEKNKFLLKKKFEKFYKMSETLKTVKLELENRKNREKNCKKLEKKSSFPKDSQENNVFNLIPLERFKWETMFFSEMNYLIQSSKALQGKLQKNEQNCRFGDKNLKKNKEKLESFNFQSTGFFFIGFCCCFISYL